MSIRLSPTKRVIHIHAGLPKTGSSAIQRFLVENRDTLASKGLVIPEAALGERGDHHDWMYRLGGLNGGDRRRAIRELIDWIDESSEETFLISSEFAYLMMRFGFAGRGFRALRRQGFAVKFHLFVRPQTDFAVSAYPEFLRNLLVPQGFGPFVEKNFLPFARDYGSIVDQLAKVSGEPVGLLPYAKGQRSDGIWWSLLESTGLTLASDERGAFSVPGMVNPSLGPVGVSALTIALKRIDRRRLAHRWGLRRALRKTVLRVTGNFPPEDARFNPMTRKQRSDLWEACRSLNDPLALQHWKQPWDEVFAHEYASEPRYNVYRRFQDDPDGVIARKHDRLAHRIVKRINETRSEVAAARQEFSLIRYLGSPLDRLADRAMKLIVRGG